MIGGRTCCDLRSAFCVSSRQGDAGTARAVRYAHAVQCACGAEHPWNWERNFMGGGNARRREGCGELQRFAIAIAIALLALVSGLPLSISTFWDWRVAGWRFTFLTGQWAHGGINLLICGGGALHFLPSWQRRVWPWAWRAGYRSPARTLPPHFPAFSSCSWLRGGSNGNCNITSELNYSIPGWIGALRSKQCTLAVGAPEERARHGSRSRSFLVDRIQFHFVIIDYRSRLPTHDASRLSRCHISIVGLQLQLGLPGGSRSHSLGVSRGLPLLFTFAYHPSVYLSPLTISPSSIHHFISSHSISTHPPPSHPICLVLYLSRLTLPFPFPFHFPCPSHIGVPPGTLLLPPTCSARRSASGVEWREA